MAERKHSHYYKPCPYAEVDVYRVLSMFEVIDPCLQHAVKKLLVAGGRGTKDIKKDVQEAIDTLQRFLEMRSEEEPKPRVNVVGMGETAFPYDKPAAPAGTPQRIPGLAEAVDLAKEQFVEGYIKRTAQAIGTFDGVVKGLQEAAKERQAEDEKKRIQRRIAAAGDMMSDNFKQSVNDPD